MDYIRRYHKGFSWRKLQIIEEKAVAEEKRIMPALKSSLEMEREEGLQEGRQEGRQERDREIAFKMIEIGADIHMICQCTDFTKEQVEKLKKDLATNSKKKEKTPSNK